MIYQTIPELAILDYKKKICSKCVGTEQQKKRKCFALYGWKSLSCMQMERYTQIHTKEHRMKEIKFLMEDLSNDLKVRNKDGEYYE